MLGQPLWLVVDGGYAKRPFLDAARRQSVTVVRRLRQDAALWTRPPAVRPAGRRGPLPRYGTGRIVLANRAGQQRGWQRVECQQYGQRVRKSVKTFLATNRGRAPGGVGAGGQERAAAVRHRPCGDGVGHPELGGRLRRERADLPGPERGVGGGEQQVRNLYSSSGAYHLNLWAQTLTEAHAWQRAEQEVVDRSQSSWDHEPRRTSQADKRRALPRKILGQQIQVALSQSAEAVDVLAVAERLLRLAG